MLPFLKIATCRPLCGLRNIICDGRYRWDIYSYLKSIQALAHIRVWHNLSNSHAQYWHRSVLKWFPSTKSNSRTSTIIIHTFYAGSDTEFQPNDYRYAFSFTLPHQLPPSFEGAHGSLRYYIKAVLGRRWMLDAVFKRGFSVNTIVDLNQNFQASVRLRWNRMRQFYGWRVGQLFYETQILWIEH